MIHNYFKDPRIFKLRKSPAFKRAYQDMDFLSNEDLRPVRLQLELLKPEMALKEHDIKCTIVVFGSARIWSKEDSQERIKKFEKACRKEPGDILLKNKLNSAKRLVRTHIYYEEARKFGRIVSEKGVSGQNKFIIVTGGGPGIMEAANRGAYEAGAKSIGLNITLPMEQGPNPYVSPEFCFRFHYFAIRKMHFMMRSRALVVFPGGFGTMDELFEALTLVQTGKKRRFPIILFGRKFWDDVINFKSMEKWGFISKEDLNLFHYAEKAQEAWEIIEDFYRKNSIEAYIK